jgi:NFU1 iron-sulfur cluster scaffold homolog, mitochondrial
VPLDVRPEPTPNPNAVRFALSAAVLGDKPRSFSSAAAAKGTPWAERIFEVPGVQSLFGLKDFLTVVKAPTAEWSGIVDPVARILSTDLP